MLILQNCYSIRIAMYLHSIHHNLNVRKLIMKSIHGIELLPTETQLGDPGEWVWWNQHVRYMPYMCNTVSQKAYWNHHHTSSAWEY